MNAFKVKLTVWDRIKIALQYVSIIAIMEGILFMAVYFA